jgi:hypothetical protein
MTSLLFDGAGLPSHSLIFFQIYFWSRKMAKTKKNKRGLSEAVTKKKSGVTKLNPFDVRTVR